jgi:Putative Actinobacterial Holin-X, holin superfamily III
LDRENFHIVSTEPSITDAVERMLSASQQFVINRLELLLLDGKQAISNALQAAIAGACAVAALFCGWLCVNAAIAASLRETLPMAGILGILAALNVVIAAIAGVAARSLATPQKTNSSGI